MAALSKRLMTHMDHPIHQLYRSSLLHSIHTQTLSWCQGAIRIAHTLEQSYSLLTGEALSNPTRQISLLMWRTFSSKAWSSSKLILKSWSDFLGYWDVAMKSLIKSSNFIRCEISHKQWWTCPTNFHSTLTTIKATSRPCSNNSGSSKTQLVRKRINQESLTTSWNQLLKNHQ